MTTRRPFDAVLVISFGGPQGMADIRPFLANVLRGRRIPPERIEEVAGHYEHFGGVSPLTEITLKQADGLRQRLASAGLGIPVFVGMRNWHPLLPDTLREMANAGVKRAIGFISAAHDQDPNFTSNVLEAAISNVNLLPNLPYLQARVGIDAEGIARLRRAISAGGLAASNFHCIANRSVSGSPPEHLAALLEDIAMLPGGVEIGLDILNMRFHLDSQEGIEQSARLVSVGRDLLAVDTLGEGHGPGPRPEWPFLTTITLLRNPLRT